MTHLRWFFLLLILACAARAELRVPAYTAYLEPEANRASISEKEGVTGWKGGKTKVVWFGKIETTGELSCAIDLPEPDASRNALHLSIDGSPLKQGTLKVFGEPAVFEPFEIKKPGYIRITLEADKPVGKIDALVLSGPASEHAHFNLLPRRNAASVHLNYTLPKDTPLDAFYAEGKAVEDPVHTFYMVCGFNRGYFGMQINSPAERRIIFSVWDSGAGKGAKTRETVDVADQTALLSKGEGVTASAFGNEGTGGHSHLVYPWKTGETQRFLLTSKTAENDSAIYSGYWFHPEKKEWMLIASFRAPKAKAELGHFHSFCENFVGSNGELRRKAFFGNQWVHTAAGQWVPVTEASFSHDGTGKEARLDREMGVEQGNFYLANGGFTGATTKYGERFTHPAGQAPPAVDLAHLPQ